MKHGRAVGVAFADGEEITRPSSYPISMCGVPFSNPCRPSICRMSSQAGTKLQDPRLLRQAQHRLRRHAQFPAIPAGSPSLRGDLHVTDTVEMMERAYDDWKEGRWSRAPYIDMLIPSQIDPTSCRTASITCRCSCSTVPIGWRTGNGTQKARPSVQTVIETIARQSPNFKGLILHAEIRTPWDIENEVGFTKGNLSGRAHTGPVALQPAHSRLCAISRAGTRLLYVRLQHSSGRRRHGRSRRERRARRVPRFGITDWPWHLQGLRMRATTASSSAAVITGWCAPHSCEGGRSVLVLGAAGKLGALRSRTSSLQAFKSPRAHISCICCRRPCAKSSSSYAGMGFKRCHADHGAVADGRGPGARRGRAQRSWELRVGCTGLSRIHAHNAAPAARTAGHHGERAAAARYPDWSDRPCALGKLGVAHSPTRAQRHA